MLARLVKVSLSNWQPLQVLDRMRLRQTKGLIELGHQEAWESSRKSREMVEVRLTPLVDRQPARLLHLLQALLCRKPAMLVKRKTASLRKTSQSNHSPGRTSTSASPTTRT